MRLRRAVTVGSDKNQIRQLHSRPTYYGALTAIWCGIPALLVFGFWLAFESNIITQLVIADLPENMRNLPDARLNLIVNDIRNLVSGNIVSGEIDPAMQAAADHYRSLETTSKAALAVVAISMAMKVAIWPRAVCHTRHTSGWSTHRSRQSLV